MAIELSDISGFTKFISTKFVDDLPPAEEPLIDVKVMAAEYAALKAEKAAMKAAAEARQAAMQGVQPSLHSPQKSGPSQSAADEEARLELIAAMAERRRQTGAASKESSPESDRRY